MAQGSYDQDDVRVKGEHVSNEDGIIIDAVIDQEGTKRLAVDTQTDDDRDRISYWQSNMCYCDMNVANGGIARDTNVGPTWTRLYQYIGSGLLIGFLINFKDQLNWDVRLVIDGNEIFGLSGINTNDLGQSTLYGYEFSTSANAGRLHFLGLDLGRHTIRWEGPMDRPMAYNSSVEIYLKKADGGAKSFRAGLVNLTKN